MEQEQATQFLSRENLSEEESFLRSPFVKDFKVCSGSKNVSHVTWYYVFFYRTYQMRCKRIKRVNN